MSIHDPVPRPKMSRTDYAYMTLSFALMGSLAWAMFTLEFLPLIISGAIGVITIVGREIVKGKSE